MAGSSVESVSRLVEDKVNKREGHVAVRHKGRALVWGGWGGAALLKRS